MSPRTFSHAEGPPSEEVMRAYNLEIEINRELTKLQHRQDLKLARAEAKRRFAALTTVTVTKARDKP